MFSIPISSAKYRLSESWQILNSLSLAIASLLDAAFMLSHTLDLFLRNAERERCIEVREHDMGWECFKKSRCIPGTGRMSGTDVFGSNVDWVAIRGPSLLFHRTSLLSSSSRAWASWKTRAPSEPRKVYCQRKDSHRNIVIALLMKYNATSA